MSHTFTDRRIRRWHFNKDMSSLLVEFEDETIAKVGLGRHPRKKNSVLEEYQVLKFLNDQNCQSCPKVFESGCISASDLTRILGKEADSLLNYSDEECQFFVMEFLRRDVGYQWSDVMLSIEEQRALGVYHGDIKPDNIAFDSLTGVCRFIDYDQSVFLDEREKNLDSGAFIDYMNAYDQRHYHGPGNWLRHFNKAGAPLESDFDTTQIYHAGSLDITNTAVMKKQRTTNSASGIYHTISTRKLFSSGSRDLSGRKFALDSLAFKPNEKVLDIGCNAGLLSWYLYDRGCEVYGVDNDQSIVLAAQQFSNIEGRKIKFYRMDLDEVDDLGGPYDTVFLFSILHHTKDHVTNALKVANSCNRIVIETRLIESGKQPDENGQWHNTTAWNAPDLDTLVTHLESIFVGHKFVQNVGSVDKGRFILEFAKP